MSATERTGAPGRALTGPPVLLAATWFAVAGGLIEATWHAFRWLILGDVIKVSPHFAWMAPLGNLILFVLPALGLLLLQRIAPSLVTRGRAAGFLAFLATLGLLSMFPVLHRAAWLIVALAAGVQTTRWVHGSPAPARTLMLATLPWMVMCAATAGLALTLVQGLRERRALAVLPEAPAGAPNVLLLILDTVRAASLGLHGYERPTSPNLETVARTGITFDRALATSPWTLPSHGTMFTGRFAHELTANWETPLDDAYPTLAEVLAGRGWVTAGFIANLFYADRPNGLARGFVHYEDYRVSIGEILNTGSLSALVLAGRPGFNFNALRNLIDNHAALGVKDAYRVNRDVLDWLDDQPAERPFFLFMNYIDAHYPYVSPPDLRERFGVSERWTYNANAYDAAIASTDRALGQLVEALRVRGLLENTIVVIASDHGEHLGEKNRTGHANSLYMENLHVPLVLSFRGAPADVRVAEFVSLRSLPATILDLAGVTDRGGIPGVSLRSTWVEALAGPGEGAPATDADVASPRVERPATADAGDPLLASVRQSIRMDESMPLSRGDLHSFVEGGFQFIHNGDASEELYDLHSDMKQEQDLIGVEAFLGVLARLREEALRLVPSFLDRGAAAGDSRE